MPHWGKLIKQFCNCFWLFPQDEYIDVTTDQKMGEIEGLLEH